MFDIYINQEDLEHFLALAKEKNVNIISISNLGVVEGGIRVTINQERTEYEN